MMSELWRVKRFADERAQGYIPEADITTPEEAMAAWAQLKEARKNYEKVLAKNLLTQLGY